MDLASVRFLPFSKMSEMCPWINELKRFGAEYDQPSLRVMQSFNAGRSLCRVINRRCQGGGGWGGVDGASKLNVV